VEGSQILYDNDPAFVSPGRSNSCYQNVNVTEGVDDLDASVVYSGAGICGCVEMVTLLVVLRPDEINEEIFSCNNENSCPENNEITTTLSQPPSPYNYSISFLNLSTSESGEYHVRLTLVDPTSSSGRSIFKVFDVNVMPGIANIVLFQDINLYFMYCYSTTHPSNDNSRHYY